jgi:hypothetical protein
MDKVKLFKKNETHHYRHCEWCGGKGYTECNCCDEKKQCIHCRGFGQVGIINTEGEAD